MIKVTKEQKIAGIDRILELSEMSKFTITNELQHKIALELVQGGIAKITKKKNYGKIAEIVEIKNV